MSQSCSSSSESNKPSKLEISFLLNHSPPQSPKPSPQPSQTSSSSPQATPTPSPKEEQIELDEDTPLSFFVNLTSSAIHPFDVLSGLSADMMPTEPSMQSSVTSGESPNHEVPTYDGTVHISLSSGELAYPNSDQQPNPEPKLQEKRRRRRSKVLTNLKQRRRNLASRVDVSKLLRRGCCKRAICFEKVELEVLKEDIKETLMMGRNERKNRLRSWFRGAFYYQGKRVCSGFLASAFGFSRDLQRSVKMGK